MRRVLAAAAAVLLVIALAVTASAATGISNMESISSVNADGTCQVTLLATIHLEQAVSHLVFPLPRNASNITLNGSKVSARRSGDVRNLDLSKLLGNIAGDFTLNIQYSLKGVVHTADSGAATLELPLLSGFAYPIEKMSFSVTLPGEVTAVPAFSSGYYQSGIERDLQTTVNGAAITGTCLTALKDHETLTMTFKAPEGMFPRAQARVRSFKWVDSAMLICALAALAYWLLFLRSLPPLGQYRAVPPEGYNAGRMGSVLHLQGMDLSLTVLSWAQLGYVLIQIDRNGRVLLHKRMDMGNERSNLERHCFALLFGKHPTVDTSSLRYAQLCQKVEAMPAGVQELVHRRSGNLRLFRALAAGVGLFGGIFLGRSLADGSVMQYFLAVVLGAAGAVSSWYIQALGYELFRWDRQKAYLCAGCCGAWLLISLLAGGFSVGVDVILSQLLAGLMAAFGGRRTAMGRQTAGQVLGLRRYLQKVPKTELKRIQGLNPDYFFTLAPYALALNVDKAFAKRFGGKQLSGCPYLTTGLDKHMTAMEWSGLIRRTVQEMDARRRHLGTERILGILHGIIHP